jgi:hypothetical protein
LEIVMLASKLMRQEKDDPTHALHDAAAYGVDIYQLEYLLTLTPAERLRRHDAALEFVLAARKAGIRHYGIHPRSTEAP